jgi:hypothetical protein
MNSVFNNMTSRIATLLFLLLLTSPLAGQSKGVITGTIKDASTGETLIGVNVLVSGTYYGAATDVNGRYIIRDINPGEYTLAVSLIGYKKIQKTGVKVSAGQRVVIDLEMDEAILSLGEEVVIIGQKPLLDIRTDLEFTHRDGGRHQSSGDRERARRRRAADGRCEIRRRHTHSRRSDT